MIIRLNLSHFPSNAVLTEFQFLMKIITQLLEDYIRHHPWTICKICLSTRGYSPFASNSNNRCGGDWGCVADACLGNFTTILASCVLSVVKRKRDFFDLPPIAVMAEIGTSGEEGEPLGVLRSDPVCVRISRMQQISKYPRYCSKPICADLSIGSTVNYEEKGEWRYVDSTWEIVPQNHFSSLIVTVVIAPEYEFEHRPVRKRCVFQNQPVKTRGYIYITTRDKILIHHQRWLNFINGEAQQQLRISR